MTMKTQSHSIDIVANRATIAIVDEAGNSHVTMMFPLETPGDQPESQLREASLAQARVLLQNALASL